MRSIGLTAIAAMWALASTATAAPLPLQTFTDTVGDPTSVNWSSGGPGLLDFSTFYSEPGPGITVTGGTYLITFTAPSPILASSSWIDTYSYETFTYPWGYTDGAQGWDDCSSPYGFCLSKFSTKVSGNTITTKFTVPESYQTRYVAFGQCCEVDASLFYSEPNFFVELSDSSFGQPFLITLSALPEPAIWAMMVVAFGFIGALARRRASVELVDASL